MRGKRLPLACTILLLSVALAGADAAKAADPKEAVEKVSFGKSILPILSDRCFKCHGPDAAERQGKLRLDDREAALKPAESGKRAIVPGKSAESELLRRILSKDPDERMPPADSNKVLSDTERELLKRWIEQGADYQRHWSFVKPVRPAPPAVKQTEWPRNEIDRFILARLEAQGLKPSAEADRATLIRRLSLDLTGLPPTPGEVDAFLADKNPGAYENLVERILASPHYGERMAVDWLDASRFADTHGFHIDSGRDMTRWREWVISAFNRNLPFDQFTVDQLAGDLLPAATLEQKVASGFNRNHMINFEGGAIPLEYHTAYIVDRVNTTATVWLGLTVGCAQCHDHKYDPISQKEFYQLFAFFHNVPENGLDGSKGNAAPLLRTPTEGQQKALDQFAAQIAQLEQQVAGPQPQQDAAQAEWEKTAQSEKGPEWVVLEPAEMKSEGGATLARQADGAILATGTNPAVEAYTITAKSELKGITAIRLEALPDDSLAAKGPGRSSNGNVVMTNVRLTAASLLEAGQGKPVKFKAASADFSQKDFPIANAIDDRPQSGWALFPEVGKPHQAIFECDAPIAVDGPATLAVTLEFRSEFGQHQLGKFRLAATTAKNPHGSSKLPDNVGAILAIAADKRTEPQKTALRKYYREQVSPESKRLQAEIAKVKASQAEIEKRISTTMVMQEMPNPRETFLLIRGQYDKKGDKVVAAVPASLPPLPKGVPANRLGLAEWLVSPEHPLTSRVTVNRFWQMLFGTGLVETSDDFGTQGSQPSHAELLDWLAVEFMSPTSSSSVPPGKPASERRAWDTKGLVRLLVTSAAYRQSSVVSRELVAKDPHNRLLARGPRFRLQAEFIRDQALAASGLLNDQIGGHSVSPYQPSGLWEELASRADGANWTAQVYKQSSGADLYRRTMYTFWKRTSPPPTLVTFDAPDRETCTVRRSRTNTPLQALILMNDPTYVEASRKLAERIMAEGGATADERIAWVFKLVTARPAKPAESAVLKRIFDRQLDVYRKDAAAAQKLLAVGESKRNAALDTSELAAWTTVSSVVLNLDEVLTKN